MPAGRVCMRNVREIVRLGSAGVSKVTDARPPTRGARLFSED